MCALTLSPETAAQLTASHIVTCTCCWSQESFVCHDGTITPVGAFLKLQLRADCCHTFCRCMAQPADKQPLQCHLYCCVQVLPVRPFAVLAVLPALPANRQSAQIPPTHARSSNTSTVSSSPAAHTTASALQTSSALPERRSRRASATTVTRAPRHPLRVTSTPIHRSIPAAAIQHIKDLSLGC